MISIVSKVILSDFHFHYTNVPANQHNVKFWVVLPSAEQPYRLPEQDTEQVTEQVKQLIALLDGQTLSTTEIISRLELKHRPTVVYHYIKPAIDKELVEMTIPEKPNSRNQRYRLTGKGRKKLL